MATFIWVTPIDEHTCPACKERYGLPAAGLAVPPHPDCTNPEGCRCVVEHGPASAVVAPSGDQMVVATEAAYRDVASQMSPCATVPEDAAVRLAGTAGAWVTVEYWVSAARMRDYLRHLPHQREGGT